MAALIPFRPPDAMLPVWLPDTVTTDLSRAVHYTLLWGLEGLVLRTVGGPDERVPFVNEAPLRRRLEEAELPVVAVDPGLFETGPERRVAWMNDLAAFAETAAFCRRVGCPTVLVGALAEAEASWSVEAAADVLRQAGTEAARYGLRLAVRNEAGTPCASGETLAALLVMTDHPNVRAAWNPAEALRAGHDPTAGLDALLALDEAIQTVTVRDGAGEDEAWVEQIPGEGDVNWTDQLARLRTSGFDGPLVLEVHGEPRPKWGLHAASALIQLIRASR